MQIIGWKVNVATSNRRVGHPCSARFVRALWIHASIAGWSSVLSNWRERFFGCRSIHLFQRARRDQHHFEGVQHPLACRHRWIGTRNEHLRRNRYCLCCVEQLGVECQVPNSLLDPLSFVVRSIRVERSRRTWSHGNHPSVWMFNHNAIVSVLLGRKRRFEWWSVDGQFGVLVQTRFRTRTKIVWFLHCTFGWLGIGSRASRLSVF